MKIILPGDTPSQKNGKQIMYNRGTGRRFVASNPRVKAWQQQALWQLKGSSSIDEYPLQVFATFYFSTNRRHDLDNCWSTVADALKNSGIIEDDDYKHLSPVILHFGGIDKEFPRAEVFLI